MKSPTVNNDTYRHTQRAPLCLLIYALGVVLFVSAWNLRNEPTIQWVLPVVGILMLVLAASFHHLTVEDEVQHLSICFGPIQLFRRTVRYEDILSVESGRTTILDGWGIHKSLRGGWVWNIWGRDCVVLQLRNGILRVGTDDAAQLIEFLQSRLAKSSC